MNAVVVFLCLVLCLINAALWTLYSEMPVVGAAWIGAAIVAVWLRKWSISFTPGSSSRATAGKA